LINGIRFLLGSSVRTGRKS